MGGVTPMTDNPKPFASLGPTLLARKGGAKPAMRPQFQPLNQFEKDASPNLDDLGWNDMGESADNDTATGSVLALTPAPANNDAQEDSRAVDAQARETLASAAKPAVRHQIESLTDAVNAPRPPKKAERKADKSAAEAKRAAFTLRLDAERHLRLRLACTLKNSSAQALVTKALDDLLGTLPELDALVSQVNRK
jgi:hypothetical protein